MKKPTIFYAYSLLSSVFFMISFSAGTLSLYIEGGVTQGLFLIGLSVLAGGSAIGIFAMKRWGLYLTYAFLGSLFSIGVSNFIGGASSMLFYQGFDFAAAIGPIMGSGMLTLIPVVLFLYFKKAHSIFFK
jgi:hypothetical protein